MAYCKGAKAIIQDENTKVWAKVLDIRKKRDRFGLIPTISRFE